VRLAEGAQEVGVVVDDAPPGFAGLGYEGKGAGIRREAEEDVAEEVIGKLPGRLVATAETERIILFHVAGGWLGQEGDGGMRL
jgi:hypothetical protein